MSAVRGEPLARVGRLQIVSGAVSKPADGALWALRGVTSNTRYTTHPEKDQLTAKQAPIGRAEATQAALIPIRKNAAWWELPQDERRHIFEESSHHTRIGLKYLPAIARRLHHCRDLGTNEPFDFLTWFEYGPQSAAAFEDLVSELRVTEEWKFVEREIDIRLAQ
jgi:chlorite dismutase